MKLEVKSFYDNLWSSNKLMEEDIKLLAIKKSAIEYSYSLLGNLKNKSLLEIGCGSGLQTIELAKRGAKVTEIDFSEKSIELLKKTAKIEGINYVTALKMNAERMKFKAGYFDFVYIDSVLMHVDKEKVLSECSRVVKKGGKVVIVDSLKYNPFVLPYRLFSMYKRTKPKYMTIGLFKKFKKYFSEMETKEFYLFSVIFLFLFKIIDKEKALKLHQIIEKIDNALVSIFPFLRSLCWIAVVGYKK